MPKHHTKDKGDIGLAAVIFDLTRRGFDVATPISEHLPFDLIAIDRDAQKLSRLSVKYRAARDGAIRLPLQSSWADRHGVHKRVHSLTDYDAVAVFCPGTSACYYVRTNELSGPSITLRLVPARSNQRKGVRFAKDYVSPARLFE